MKTILALVLSTSVLVWPCTSAAQAPGTKTATTNSVSGEVLEIKNVDSYTYMRIKTPGGETWAAVTKADVKNGAQVTIENAMVMNNFESKSLKRTFDTIVFGTLGASGKQILSAHADHNPSNASAGTKIDAKADAAPIKVPKATGANARTIGELYEKSAALKDKSVEVRGKVVKYNTGIMGKNWVHLQDGSGSAANGTHDLLVTTSGQTKPGDVITVQGVVHTNKDFGAGYSYKVILEDATIKP